MSLLHVVGIDPGLVHTGVVCIRLNTSNLVLSSTHELFIGPDVQAVKQWVWQIDHPVVFIEKYRARSHFGTDERMVKAEAEFKRAMQKATLLDNTGVLKIVTQDLLELLGLWKFATPTHHQDLRSAARIAVLGMLRDPEMNGHLARYVKAVLDVDI